MNQDQQLREDIAEIDTLSRLLFEQQFIRCGGRKDGDPTWDDLEPAEQEEYWDRALDVQPLLAERDATIQQLRDDWRQADQQHLRDGYLLLWLHAEAVWQQEQAVMEEALRWRKIAEQWERGHQNDVLPYTTSLETEVDLLRREVEFEANGLDWQVVAATPGQPRRRVCACSINFAAMDPERWSLPQCSVHPEGGGA